MALSQNNQTSKELLVLEEFSAIREQKMLKNVKREISALQFVVLIQEIEMKNIIF